MYENAFIQNDDTGKAVMIVTRIVTTVTHVFIGDTLVQFSSRGLM